jgi:transposase-like protein
VAKKATKGKRGVRYSKEKKAEILAAAKKDKLTGEQVAKRFGISTLTFYRWRGPVRKAAIARHGRKRGPGRPKGSGKVKVDAAAVRREVQAQVRRLLPQIIREEVAAALGMRKD